MASESTHHQSFAASAEEALRDFIAQFTRSRRQQVTALVAYGSPGIGLEQLWNELGRSVLGKLAPQIAAQWVPIHFPQLRERLYADLEYELQTQLAARPGEVMQDILTRIAPPDSTPGLRILWLDWGVFGEAIGHRRRLSHHELQTWLQFCSDFLTVHCPPNVRIVAHLAIESDDRAGLEAFLDQQRAEPWCRSAEFRLKSLPIVGPSGPEPE
ncbi:MAG: hypothetical protein AAGC55_27120 [Myxococcota bacterium]